SSYWRGDKYLGIGPSAHSFSANERQWNIANNVAYIESISKGIIPCEKEQLTSTQQLNEYIMISLRTSEGLSLKKISSDAAIKLKTAAQKYIDAGLMLFENDYFVLTNEGKLLADGIAASLFF
ncbi:MAG TPA: coproporphyrinogen III oxidase, partial [Chitinophagaceae bacterium]|nr:coproporphyrinogen III oxidase [Chitinophagaceae bacterium]